MTTTELRDALGAVADAVEVPLPDVVAFQARVRAERGRRTRGRLAVGSAAAAVALVAGIAVATAGSHSPGGGPVSRPSPTVTPVPGRPYVPLLLDGHVVVLLPDGSSYAEDLPAARVLGVGAQGVVYVGPDGRLGLLPLAADGEPQRPKALTAVPVAQAVVSGDGTALAWVGSRGDTHLRTSSWGFDSTAPVVSGRLVSANGTGVLGLTGGHLVLADAGAPVVLQDGTPATGGQVAGDTVAYQTASGVELYDLHGHQRFGDLGGAIGALSPDGERYVTTPDEDQRRSERLAPTLRVIDTHTGAATRIEEWQTGQHVLSFWWQTSDRFLVVTTSPREPGNRLLWTCSVSADRCGKLYDDPDGTLELPTG